MFRGSRDIAASREKAGNGDIFVKRFPVQADAAELDLVAFVRRCMEQARKPRERDSSVLPSDSSTHIVCSSKRTLVAEMDMPSLQKKIAVVFHHAQDIRKLPRIEAITVGY